MSYRNRLANVRKQLLARQHVHRTTPSIMQRIGEILPSRPEYVYQTSEFLEVQERLAALTQRTVEEGDDPNKPTLRRAPSDGTIPADGEEPTGEEEDERPTLKRRP